MQIANELLNSTIILTKDNKLLISGANTPFGLGQYWSYYYTILREHYLFKNRLVKDVCGFNNSDTFYYYEHVPSNKVGISGMYVLTSDNKLYYTNDRQLNYEFYEITSYFKDIEMTNLYNNKESSLLFIKDTDNIFYAYSPVNGRLDNSNSHVIRSINSKNITDLYPIFNSRNLYFSSGAICSFKNNILHVWNTSSMIALKINVEGKDFSLITSRYSLDYVDDNEIVESDFYDMSTAESNIKKIVVNHLTSAVLLENGQVYGLSSSISI